MNYIVQVFSTAYFLSSKFHPHSIAFSQGVVSDSPRSTAPQQYQTHPCVYLECVGNEHIDINPSLETQKLSIKPNKGLEFDLYDYVTFTEDKSL